MSRNITVAIIGALATIIGALIQVIGPEVIKRMQNQHPTTLTSPSNSAPKPTIDQGVIEASVYTAISIGGEIRKDVQRRPYLQNALKIAIDTRKIDHVLSLRQRIQEIQESIQVGLTKYSNTFTQLEKFESVAVAEAFQKYRNDFARQSATEQKRICEIVQQHFYTYYKRGKVDLTQCQADLEN